MWILPKGLVAYGLTFFSDQKGRGSSVTKVGREGS